jgi:hypothetical protein
MRIARVEGHSVRRIHRLELRGGAWVLIAG